MLKYGIVMAVSVATQLYGLEVTQQDTIFPHTFVQAVILQESGGNTRAIGDNGRAAGCMQIWKVNVDDCNRIAKIIGCPNRYKYEDRFDVKKSIEMFELYTGYYDCFRRTKMRPSLENKARIWNAGPNGYKKECSKKYWNDIVDKMKGLK